MKAARRRREKCVEGIGTVCVRFVILKNGSLRNHEKGLRGRDGRHIARDLHCKRRADALNWPVVRKRTEAGIVL